MPAQQFAAIRFKNGCGRDVSNVDDWFSWWWEMSSMPMAKSYESVKLIEKRTIRNAGKHYVHTLIFHWIR